MPDDIIRDALRRARALHPETPASEWMQIEAKLRQDWGGLRPYIPKASASGKACLLANCLAAGISVSEAFSAIGVGRTTGYRLLARRWIAW